MPRAAETAGCTTAAWIKAFGSEGKKTAVISTINGDANSYFYEDLTHQRVDANEIPVTAFSIGERDFLGAEIPPVGHPAAWSYFQSINSAEKRSVHQNVGELQQATRQNHK